MLLLPATGQLGYAELGPDTESTVYAGLLALLVNLLVAVLATLVLRPRRWTTAWTARPRPTTPPSAKTHRQGPARSPRDGSAGSGGRGEHPQVG